jgi:predicted amidophosphoribosyltransferase
VSRAVTTGGASVSPWQICYACASQKMEPLPEDRCQVCAQKLKEDGECPNYVCGWPSRQFLWVRAISMRTGYLKGAIDAYKYEGQRGWAAIFGRVLVGFLDANVSTFSSFDAIVPSPTYVGPDGRDFDHTGLVLEAASIEAFGTWPFEHGFVVQTAHTEPLVKASSWRKRREIAEGPLREALEVPDSTRVRGKRILVYDDIFTDGFTTREVAGVLRRAGATEVCEVVLARQPRRAR